MTIPPRSLFPLLFLLLLLGFSSAKQDIDVFVDHLYQTATPALEAGIPTETNNPVNSDEELFWEISYRNQPCTCDPGPCDGNNDDVNPPFEHCSGGGATITNGRIRVQMYVEGNWQLAGKGPGDNTDDNRTSANFQVPWFDNISPLVLAEGDLTTYFVNGSVSSLQEILLEIHPDLDPSPANLSNFDPNFPHFLRVTAWNDTREETIAKETRSFNIINPNWQPYTPDASVVQSTDIEFINPSLNVSGSELQFRVDVRNNHPLQDVNILYSYSFCQILNRENLLDSDFSARKNVNDISVQVAPDGSTNNANVICSDQQTCTFHSANGINSFYQNPYAQFNALYPSTGGEDANTLSPGGGTRTLFANMSLADNGGYYRCRMGAFFSSPPSLFEKESSLANATQQVDGYDLYVKSVNPLNYYVLPDQNYGIQLIVVNSGSLDIGEGTTLEPQVDASFYDDTGFLVGSVSDLPLIPAYAGTEGENIQAINIQFDLGTINFSQFLGVDNFQYNLLANVTILGLPIDYSFFNGLTNLLIARLIKIYNPDNFCAPDPGNIYYAEGPGHSGVGTCADNGGICGPPESINCLCPACFDEDEATLPVVLGQDLSFDILIQNPLPFDELFSLDYFPEIAGVPGLDFTPSTEVPVFAADTSQPIPFGRDFNTNLLVTIPSFVEEDDLNVLLEATSETYPLNIRDFLLVSFQVQAANLTITDMNLTPAKNFYPLSSDPMDAVDWTVRVTNSSNENALPVVLTVTTDVPPQATWNGNAVLGAGESQVFTGTLPAFNNIGNYSVTATVDPAPGELQLTDNQKSIFLTVGQQSQLFIPELTPIHLFFIIVSVLYLLVRT